MATYFHFLKQDLKDSSSAWLTGAVLLTILLACNQAYALASSPFSSLYYCGIAFVIAWPGFPYRRIVWGGAAPGPISRAYLKTLPMSRTRTFWLCFARGLPANVPFLLYVVWAITHFKLLPAFAARYRGFETLTPDSRFTEILLCLGLMGVFLVYSEIASAINGVLEERLTRTTDRWRRTLNRVESILAFCVTQYLFFTIAWMGFCFFYGLSPSLWAWFTAFAAIPATAVLLFWTYRAWLWT